MSHLMICEHVIQTNHEEFEHLQLWEKCADLKPGDLQSWIKSTWQCIDHCNCRCPPAIWAYEDSLDSRLFTFSILHLPKTTQYRWNFTFAVKVVVFFDFTWYLNLLLWHAVVSSTLLLLLLFLTTSTRGWSYLITQFNSI